MAHRGNALHVFYIEGNIGAGKSTLLKTLSLLKNWEYWCEPNYNIFERYHPLDVFRQKPNTAAVLQLHILDIMFADIKNHFSNFKYSPTHNVIFIERSLESTFIFNDAAYLMGYITSFEHDFVEKKGEIKLKEIDVFLRESFPDVIILKHNIFLDVTYETCLRRVTHRDSGEHSLESFSKYLLVTHGLHHKKFTPQNSFLLTNISSLLPHAITEQVLNIVQSCLKKS